MSLNLGRWEHLRGTGSFKCDGPTFVGTSGGRTSAMLALLADPTATLCFANTGREREETLEFLRDFDRAVGGRVVWLEWRPPRRRGAPPSHARFARINFESANRDGAIFEEWMEYVNAYRAEEGEDVLTPAARQRLCTVQLKHRVIDRFIRSVGVCGHDRFVGIRADESHRVDYLKRESTSNKRFLTPLVEAGIAVDDVNEFWSLQPFNLQLESHEGNCTLCFLKDQSHRSRLAQDSRNDIDWWVKMQNRWPGFGGFDAVPYAQLLAEGPSRVAIERAIRSNPWMLNASAKDVVSALRKTIDLSAMPGDRARLVVIQERKMVNGEVATFSCSCESSMGGEDDEDQLSFDFDVTK